MRKRLTRYVVLVSLVSLVSQFTCAAAFAQTNDDRRRSDLLFDEGKSLMAAGRVPEACERFAQSFDLVPRGGTLLNLGMCTERQGKWLLARRQLREALEFAHRDGRQDRVPIAMEHLKAVEAKLSWIHVIPPENALAVSMNGTALGRGEWDAIPVEPGAYRFVATAAGFQAREELVTIEDGPPRQLTVRIEPLDTVPPLPTAPLPEPRSVPATSAPSVPSAALVADPVPAARTRKERSPLRTAALITGISGLALSVAAGIWALERKGAVRDRCDARDKVCDPEGEDAAAMGRVLVIGSTAAFAVGAIGIGGWFLLPDRSPRGAGASGAGFAVGGAF